MLLKVLHSADDNKPLLDALADGRLNVCTVPELVIPKLVPDVPVAKVCDVPNRPFTDVIDPPVTESGVHTGEAGVPVFTLNRLSVVLNTSKPVAGKEMAFCWTAVILGARKPLLVLAISSIALASGIDPSVLMAMFCDWTLFIRHTIVNIRQMIKFFML